MSNVDDIVSGALGLGNVLTNGIGKLNTILQEASGAVKATTVDAATPSTIVNQTKAATVGTTPAAAVTTQAKSSNTGLLIGIALVVVLLLWKKG
jgi:hypothetical protein